MKTTTRFRPSQTISEVTIDATPVMNMFVILIPFLVGMAAFSQLAVQRLALPGNEAADSAQTEADAPLLVSVTGSEILAMRGNRTIGRIDRGDHAGSKNPEDLGADLASLLHASQRLFPDLHHVTLALADEVVCADVVACFDTCQKAGFVDVGVAEAVR
ncbi:MAG: biopolymer transporter ExbD [Candidatus Eisenbacteria bacterium]|uniref:Biopolymer transporter ExbD n=1 Tax=Eiseniibacteriota bacterium TaxID=2212470 RepID=A0A956M0B8_UNCEI|nr:biopolymer transporter ExbD [Candidatus Eisenbacteria bacterium]